ncbi:MAG: hypothetical protein ACTSSP_03310 [Candidatus Asgardarchaeia archaeon]
MGSTCEKALRDCYIYNYHNYKGDKKTNTDDLSEVNKLDWKIDTKKDKKMNAKFIERNGNIEIKPCPSGGWDKFKQQSKHLLKITQVNTVKAKAEIEKDAYKIYFCLIHSLLLMNLDKKILDDKIRNNLRETLKRNCKNKFNDFRNRQATWEYQKEKEIQHISFCNQIGTGRIIYAKTKMIGFGCGIQLNNYCYAYTVDVLNWTVEKIKKKIRRRF